MALEKSAGKEDKIDPNEAFKKLLNKRNSKQVAESTTKKIITVDYDDHGGKKTPNDPTEVGSVDEELFDNARDPIINSVREKDNNLANIIDGIMRMGEESNILFVHEMIQVAMKSSQYIPITDKNVTSINTKLRTTNPDQQLIAIQSTNNQLFKNMNVEKMTPSDVSTVKQYLSENGFYGVDHYMTALDLMKLSVNLSA